MMVDHLHHTHHYSICNKIQSGICVIKRARANKLICDGFPSLYDPTV